MISSLDVGARFLLEDGASATLLRMTDALKLLNEQSARAKELLGSISQTAFKGLETRLGNVTDSVKAIGDAGASAAEKMASSFDAAALAMSTSLAKVAKQMEELAVAGGAAGVGGGGRGSGRRPIGDAGGPRLSGPAPGLGGWHMHGLSGPAMVGAAGAIYGAYEAARVEDVIARAAYTGQVKLDNGMVPAAARDQMLGVIKRVSSETGISPQEVGEALLAGERVYGGLPFDQRLRVEESIASRAAAESRMKEGTSFKEAFEVMAGLPHMIGEYRPDQQAEALRAFSYASLITPASISQFGSSFSYSMPILNAAGITDPDTVMFMSAMMQTAGIRNTKSGTWLRSFYEGLQTRGTGDPRDNKHDAYLRDMGLVDDQGRPLWQVNNPDGSPDQMATLLKIASVINTYEHTEKDPAKRLATVHGAFGERGGGVASMLALDQWIEQFPTIAEKMKTFKGGDDFMAFMGQNSPVFMADKSLADLQLVLMDLGTITLPPLVKGLQGLDNILKAIEAGIDDFKKAGSWWQFFKDQTVGPDGPPPGTVLGALSNWWYGGGAGSPTLSGGAPAGIRARGAGGAVGAGESNLARMAYDYWRGQGLSHDQALSVIGNERGENVLGSLNTAGGSGQFQWDATRRAQILAGTGIEVRTAGFLDQQKAARWEMENSPDAQNRVWNSLKAAKTTEAQVGVLVHNYERSKWQASDIAIRMGNAERYRRVIDSSAAATSPPIPGVALDRAYKDQQGGDMDPSTHAHAKAVHVHTALHVDGKMLAQVTQKHIVRRNQFTYGPSHADFGAIPQTVDSGMGSAVSA